MADIVDRTTRSRMMSGIRGKHTQPELALRRALHKKGLRYRLHVRDLPGRPDIVMPKHHVAIQVHGCFWHRHKGCRFCTNPSSNRSFWKKKFKRTIERDRMNTNNLLRAGWRTAIVWECALDGTGVLLVANTLIKWLAGTEPFLEVDAKEYRRQSKGKGEAAYRGASG
jgi:DNA mismatch endonuclease (patch repair protein)